ncbi:MAG: hypothetical protein AB8V00_07825 [Francisella endosymbiont of Hyalomma asiaticum]
MFYTLYVRDNFSPIKSILLAIIIGLYNEFFTPFTLSGTIMIAPGNFIRTGGVLDGQSVLIYVF